MLRNWDNFYFIKITMNNQEVTINNNRTWCFWWCLSVIVVLAILGYAESISSTDWTVIIIIWIVAVVCLFIWNEQKKRSQNTANKSKEMLPPLWSLNLQEESFFKDCPYCGESIQKTAKKCKHCGERLTERDK
jgi:tRNA(Ile2) C34 agmatinyltransferase TiaS